MSSSHLNFLTSFAFVISGLYSYFRGNNFIYHGSIMCLITSTLYHGSLIKKVNSALRNSLKIIDILTTHLCVLFYLIESMGFNIWTYISLACILYMIILYYYYSASHHPKYGYYVHSSIHIIGNIGVMSMVESYLS